jgi:hypothetical protein
MTKDDILATMRLNDVNIEFMKVDGTMRTMVATLNGDKIVSPPGDPSETKAGAVARKTNTESCSVWDVEGSAWKAFRWANLRSVNGTHLPNGLSE